MIKPMGNDKTDSDWEISSLILNNVVCEMSSKYGIWMQGATNLTVKGENTRITNTYASGNIWRTNVGAIGSVVTIEAGELSGYDVCSGGKVTTYLKGGNITTSGGIYFGAGHGCTNTVYFEGATVNGLLVLCDRSTNYPSYGGEGDHVVYITSGLLKGQLVVEDTIDKATINITGGTLVATDKYADKGIVDLRGVAEVNISGGTLSFMQNYNEAASSGQTDATTGAAYAINIYVAAAATVNISGGSLHGGNSYGAIDLHNDDAVLNISGTAKISGFRAVFVNSAATVTMTGGTLLNNAGQPNSNLVDIVVAGATFDMSGGSIVTGKWGVYLQAAGKVNISGAASISATRYGDTAILIYAIKTAAGAEINISGGSFDGDRIVALYDGAATANITGGSFTTSNTATYTSDAYMFQVGNGAQMTISGVTATGTEATKAFFCVNNISGLTTPAVLNINGGTFDGAKSWIFANRACNITIDGATFTDTQGTLAKPIGSSYIGAINSNHADCVILVKSGTFTIPEANTANAIFYCQDLTIEDGTFTGSPNNTIISMHGAASPLTIKDGVFRGSSILQTYASSDITISGGEFYGTTAASNTSGDDRHLIVVGAPGAKLTITDGKFVGNEYNYCLIACNSDASAGVRTVSISGGTFEGAYVNWFFINQGTNLTIDGATFTDKGTLRHDVSYYGAIFVRENGNVNDVNVTIKSGTFNLTAEGSMVPLFTLQEKNVVIEGGTFNVYRVANLEHVSKAMSLTITGGFFNVTGDKAIYLTSIGLDSDANDKHSVAINGGTFVMSNEEALAVVYGVTSRLASFSVNAITVLTKNTYTAVYGNNTLENVVIGIGDENALMVPANGPVVKYAGELYRTYVLTPATDAEKDVANSDGAYKGAGVEIGKNYDNSGIRFTTVLSAEVRAALQAIVDAGNSTLIFGTLIAPADYVAAAKAFTIEALDALVVDLAEGKEKYVAIEAKESLRYEKETDVIPSAYSAAIVKLQEANFGRALAAISYVEIWDNTTHECVVYYGSFDSTVNARSMREIALSHLVAKGTTLGETELEGTLKYAGFTAEAPAAVNWNAGKIGTNGAITSAAGYYYSDLIYLEKAGTVVTFTDADGSFAGSDTLVVSRWNAEGTALLNDHCSFAGGSADVTYSYGSTSYRYVSSFDGEYIRLCYTGSGDASVYTYETTEVGTLVSNLTLYNDYVRDVFFAESSADFYDEALSGLKMAAVGDSYFNDPNVMPNMWIELLAEKYGMDFDNHGISGSTIANDTRPLPENHSSYSASSHRASNSMVQRVKGVGNKAFSQTVDPTVNVVFFDGGRNDLTRGIRLGDATIDNKDEATVLGAINVIIEHLHTLYPNALIVCLNPWSVSKSYTYTYNLEGDAVKCTQNQYAEAIHAQHLLNAEKYPGYVVAYDLADKEATGVDMDSKLFTEYYTKTYTDISHLNSHGAMKFLPVIEKYLSDEYAKFSK